MAVLAAASSAELSVSAVIKALPSRFTASDRLQNFPVETSKSLLQAWRNDPVLLSTFIGDEYGLPVHLDNTDGLRITFDNQNVIHLRPSGNAPELRCYSESTSTDAAENITRSILGGIAHRDNQT
ncbi:phosphomannomutase [Undibacterium sp. GrIS 1.8]|uniref:hypothetical protein n=1 Tax=Undibacterium sp. GrIS 1.8 TaxID=3143934 RepID=UPI003393132C